MVDSLREHQNGLITYIEKRGAKIDSKIILGRQFLRISMQIQKLFWSDP
jgi:hypothetical protein